ncbi:hypothetical protein Hanom_Chr11g00992271 [Helianthus anomalus]
MDGPCGLRFTKFLDSVTSFLKVHECPCGLYFANHPYTFGKLGTKSKILINHTFKTICFDLNLCQQVT